MKNRKFKALIGLLLLLAAACVPQTGRVHSSQGLFGSGDQCKAMARKQLKLARNGGTLHKKHFRKTGTPGNISNPKVHKTTAFAPARFVYFTPHSRDTTYFPEALASVSAEDLSIASFRRSGNTLTAFPAKNQPVNSAATTKATKTTESKAGLPGSGKSSSTSPPNETEKELAQTGSEDHSAGIFFSLTGILSAGMLAAFRQKVKRISEWAAANRGKARTLLSAIRIFTAIAALAAGNYLAEQGTWLSEISKEVAVVVFVAAALLYPMRQARFRLFEGGYLRQKLHDIVLFTCGTLMLVYAGNRYEFVSRPAATQQTVFSLPAFSPENHSVSLVKNTPVYTADEPDDEQPAQENKTGLKILLTILVAGVFFLVTLLLAALACQIACAGFGGLALLFFFAGEAGAIVLLVMALKKIFPKRKKPADNLETAPAG